MYTIERLCEVKKILLIIEGFFIVIIVSFQNNHGEAPSYALVTALFHYRAIIGTGKMSFDRVVWGNDSVAFAEVVSERFQDLIPLSESE